MRCSLALKMGRMCYAKREDVRHTPQVTEIEGFSASVASIFSPATHAPPLSPFHLVEIFKHQSLHSLLQYHSSRLSQFPRCRNRKEMEKPVPLSSTSPTASRTVALASDSFKGISRAAAAAGAEGGRGVGWACSVVLSADRTESMQDRGD